MTRPTRVAGENAKPKKFELDEHGRDLVARVADGDVADVMRFADYVGPAGLIELSHSDDTRALSLAAMEYSPGFSCAGLLSEVAKNGSDDDARLALTSLHGIVARPRRATDDIEDRAELAYTCETMNAISKDASKKERADLATSVLRMLADYGCSSASVDLRKRAFRG